MSASDRDLMMWRWGMHGPQADVSGMTYPARCVHCVLPGATTGAHTPSRIEDVAIGDLVTGMDGRQHRVTGAVTHQYSGHVITIRARAALPLTVTAEHQFLCLPAFYRNRHHPAGIGWRARIRAAPSGERPAWKRADELLPGDYLLSPIPHLDGPEPPARWRGEGAWLLGQLAGDGWTSGRNGVRYYLGCVMSRESDLERAHAAMVTMGLRPSVRRLEKCARIRACSREIAEDVAGLIGTSSPVKKLPPFTWSSKEQLAETLDGLVAADGHRYESRSLARTELSSTSITLAWQAWHAAIALGEQPYIRTRRRTTGYENAKPSWTVDWSESSRHHFVGRTDEFYAMPVQNLSTAPYAGPVHDITVADIHTFTANGLLTHNCQRVYDLAKVEVTARYADCSMWRTPCCKILADDRTPPWGVRHYWELDEHGQEKRQR